MQKTTILHHNTRNIFETYECITIFTEHYKNIISMKENMYPPIFLYGKVGAGKTAFVKHALSLMGADISGFSSPTFVLIAEYYSCENKFFHIDLYRIDNKEDILLYEIDEHIKQGVVFVEWAEKMPSNDYASSCYSIYIDILDEKSRDITIEFSH